MKKKELGLVATICPVFRIILYLILLPQYGILGLVLAQLIGGLFKRLLEFFLFLKITDVEATK